MNTALRIHCFFRPDFLLIFPSLFFALHTVTQYQPDKFQMCALHHSLPPFPPPAPIGIEAVTTTLWKGGGNRAGSGQKWFACQIQLDWDMRKKIGVSGTNTKHN